MKEMQFREEKNDLSKVTDIFGIKAGDRTWVSWPW